MMRAMETIISKTIKETRLARGESQEDFAYLIGCCRVSLSLYETGKTQPNAGIYEKVLKLKELLYPEQGKGRP